MRRFIIDTSVIAKLFLEGEDEKEKVFSLFEKANQDKIELFAPSLMLYELTNTLIKRGASIDDVNKSLSVIQNQINAGNIEIIEADLELLKKSAEIAMIDTKGQGHISAYDATFHALALLQDAVFITADKKHYQKTKVSVGYVVLLSEWEIEYIAFPVWFLNMNISQNL